MLPFFFLPCASEQSPHHTSAGAQHEACPSLWVQKFLRHTQIAGPTSRSSKVKVAVTDPEGMPQMAHNWHRVSLPPA